MSAPVVDLQARRAARVLRDTDLRAAAAAVTDDELMAAVDHCVGAQIERLRPVLKQFGRHFATLITLAAARDRLGGDGGHGEFAIWALASVAFGRPELGQIPLRNVRLRLARERGVADGAMPDCVDDALDALRRVLAREKFK